MKLAICTLFFVVCVLIIFVMVIARIFCQDWFEDDNEYK